MRPIEFRGYNLKNKVWLYGHYFVNRGRHFIVTGDELENPFPTPEDFEIDASSIGQYTGLSDNKGVKIYEGDCVSWGHKEYIIHMYQGAFMLSSTPNKLAVSNKLFSVLGNEYEAMQQIPSHLLPK